MSNGANQDYKFGTKNNWRRWAWNRICDITPRIHEATIIYMPGTKDLDRPVAVSKGFRSRNMIAVERDRETLFTLRRNGIACVNGDFIDVLMGWPPAEKVDVIFGDFCGGLTKLKLTQLSTLSLLPQFKDAAFCFNFLRGRDQSCNDLRSSIALDSGLSAATPLHRGRVFYCGLVTMVICAGMEDIDAEKVQSRINFMRSLPEPQFFSYKSKYGTSVNVFDSVCFTHPLRGLEIINLKDIADQQHRHARKLRRVDRAYKSTIATRAVLSRRASMGATS